MKWREVWENEMAILDYPNVASSRLCDSNVNSMTDNILQKPLLKL